MKIALLAVTGILCLLLMTEITWRVRDWPQRDPGWLDTGRICAEFLVVIVAMNLLQASA